MDRAEKIGLGIAVAGHAVLFGLLSVGFLATPNPAKLEQHPVEVSLVEDVGIEATAPQAVEPPAQSVAPEQGAPEDAAAPVPEDTAPEPEPAPPQPAAKPQPRPQPAPEPKPAPAAKPAPAPKPASRTTPAAKPAAPSRTTATRTAAAPAKPSAAKGSGTSATAAAPRPRGSRLGNDFLKGLTSEPSPSRSEAPRAAKVGAQTLASIGSAILRQVQPCADRQVKPGPGAERIRVTINLRLNRNGSLAQRPRVVGRDGVDDDNRRYVDRVDDLAIATFTGCSPLTGLPDELYDVQNGWSNFTLRYKLPG